MAPTKHLPLNLRFGGFALLSIPFAAVLFTFIMFAAAAVFKPAGEQPGGGLAELATVLFLTIVMALVMTFMTLPLTLPPSLVAWVAIQRFLPDHYSVKRHVRITAGITGLTGSAAMVVLLALSGDFERWKILALFLVPSVVIAALISAEIVYRPAKREMT